MGCALILYHGSIKERGFSRRAERQRIWFTFFTERIRRSTGKVWGLRQIKRGMLKIFNPELSATLVYEYGGFKRVIDCRAYGEPKILKKEVLYEFDLQIECLNPFWREEEETKEDIASWVAAWHFPCRYLRRQGCNKDTDAEHHRPAV